MASKRIGKLPPRYAYLLNPHAEVRLSKCPKCQKPTHLRKFALLIHVDDWGPMVLGKTCRYCSWCELIMVHQEELEAELTYSFSRIAPEVIGNQYLVIGTIEKKIWQEGVKSRGIEFAETLKHSADFKEVYDLEYEPGGWYFAGDERRKAQPPGKRWSRTRRKRPS